MWGLCCLLRGTLQLAAKNKCLADSNKTRTSAKPTDAAGGLLIIFVEWLQPLRRPRAGQAPYPLMCRVFCASAAECGPGWRAAGGIGWSEQNIGL